MLDLDFAKQEVASSNISATSKFLLRWILDITLFSSSDPLFGLVPKKALRKGRREYARMGIAYAYSLRRAGGMTSDDAVDAVSRLWGRIARSKMSEPKASNYSGRSTILAAQKKYGGHLGKVPEGYFKKEVEFNRLADRQLSAAPGKGQGNKIKQRIAGAGSQSLK